MSKRRKFLESISETIADYRKGEIPPPTPDHVERWVEQFNKSYQVPLLEELDHALKRTYISKRTVRKFIGNLLSNGELAGEKPCRFWKDIVFLDIQKGGNSQKEMLAMFDSILGEKCGLTIAKCGRAAKAFLYLDDGLFTGNRVKNDLTAWIKEVAPTKAELHVVIIALHTGGKHYAADRIKETAKKEKKDITITWWRVVTIEDRKVFIDSSEVLKPSRLPDDERTAEYVSILKDSGYPPILRTVGNGESSKIFSCEEGRDVLEQQFLKGGLKIREICPYLKENHRPLGYMVLKTLGFGSLIVTYRNCPNNCPLVFWADDPWYPLFPRKTN